jgi:hypothetical protein
MSSVPLAALSINTKPPDPIEEYGRVMQLKSLAGQQQTQQLQQVGLQQENQMRAQQLQDQQAQTAALKDWDGKSLDELPGLLLKHGGSATAVFGMKNQILQQKTALTKLQTDQLANQKGINDQLLGKLQAATSGDDAGLPQRVTQATQDAVQQGLLDPQHAQGIQQILQQNQDPKALRNQLSIMEKGLMGQSEQFNQEQKNRETTAQEQTASAKVQEAGIEAQKFGASLPGGISENPEQKYLRISSAQQQGQPLSDADKSFLQSYKTNKTMVPAFNFNMQNAGATGQAGQPSVIAKGLADGSIKWQDVVSNRTPIAVKQQILAEVKGINPNFNSGDFSIEQGVKKEFTSGDAAKSLTAFNTAIEHAKQLSTATDALNNGDIRGLNKIGNALGYQFGSDKTTNFNVIKNALSGEISKVFKGGGATDAEIEQVQGPFNSANSPQQLKGAIAQAQALMESKRQALQQQYQAGVKAQPNFGGAQPQQNAPVKTISAAAVAQAAKDHGVSVEEATRQAKAAGYAIQ